MRERGQQRVAQALRVHGQACLRGLACPRCGGVAFTSQSGDELGSNQRHAEQHSKREQVLQILDGEGEMRLDEEKIQQRH